MSKVRYKQGVTENKMILLSADREVSLYQVSKDIWNHFDELVVDFYKWKKTNRYDEKLFVKYLKSRFSEESINFIKIVGNYEGSPNTIWKDGKDITEQYANTKWHNF